MTEKADVNPETKIPLKEAYEIAHLFDLREPFKIFDFPEKGNIHRRTYLVSADQSRDCTEYLLQMLNTDVFDKPESVMATMISCIRAQQESLSEGVPDDEVWETPRLVPTKEGALYLKTNDRAHPQYWRMMHRIRNARSFKSLSEIRDPEKRMRIAEEAGKGLALFGLLTAGMDTSSVSAPLPGYRNAGLYYNQLASVLEGSRSMEEASGFLPSDTVLQQSTGRHFLVQLEPDRFRLRMNDRDVQQLAALALDQKSFCMKLQRGLESGNLKTSIVHGDPKLDNFLFCVRTGKVKALIDLDTVMPHTWLSDWGDMARSFINISGEKQADWDEIEINLDVFKALAKGFIGSASHVRGNEMELMVDAARIMALELGVRFLTDYLRGDTYFRRSADSPEDLNKTRAAVQFSVFRSLGEQAAEAGQYVSRLHRDRGDHPFPQK